MPRIEELLIPEAEQRAYEQLAKENAILRHELYNAVRLLKRYARNHRDKIATLTNQTKIDETIKKAEDNERISNRWKYMLQHNMKEPE